MNIYLFALLIGIVAGLRALTPLAAISWAAYAGRLHLQNTWLAFLGATITPYVASFLALGELFNDKLPKTASRKTPMMFGARIVMGALCGAALGASSGAMIGGLIAGAFGAVIGTLGGAAMRTGLARAIGGQDLPAALIEDVVAIAAAVLIVTRFA